MYAYYLLKAKGLLALFGYTLRREALSMNGYFLMNEPILKLHVLSLLLLTLQLQNMMSL